MDAALENVYAASISQEEVGSLLNEIKSEQGMKAGGEMAGVGTGAIPAQAQKDNEIDQMQSKLDQLKNL